MDATPQEAATDTGAASPADAEALSGDGAYNQPPHPSFLLSTPQVPVPDVRLVRPAP